jgi:hypothetical protein
VTLRNSLFGTYALVCFGAMTWPGYARFGNSVEPYVGGLPFSLAWVVGWVLLSFVALIAYHSTGRD